MLIHVCSYSSMFSKTSGISFGHSFDFKFKFWQYDPSRAKFAEIKLIEKKPLGLISKSNKYAFQFQQSKLSYYKDTKVSWRTPLLTTIHTQVNPCISQLLFVRKYLGEFNTVGLNCSGIVYVNLIIPLNLK